MSAEPRSLPRISVVIPARNAEGTLGEQLEALANQIYDGTWDVVVVDNGSTDATGSVARSYDSRLPLRVISARNGASAAYARNVGIASSTGELIVFLDGDDVASPGLLQAYAAHAGRYAVMGGHLDDYGLNDPVTASWRYPITGNGLPTAFDRFVFFVSANCAVARHVFDRVGMFDETLEYVGEDVDFSIRSQLAGFEIGWVSDAVVQYRHRASLASLARQYYAYGRGSVVLYERYRSLAAPSSRLVDSARAAGGLLRGLPSLVRGRSERGRWLMLASAMRGQVVESARRRVWYVG